MKYDSAPLFTDVAPGPENGRAHWVNTSDGLRIRIAHWRPPHARGTVLIFPGRTEYIEKYGCIAADFYARGYACVCVDWRGQGMADRLVKNPRIGHVNKFADFQRDVAALMQAVQVFDLPAPFYFLGHSMGGCIGLRALHEGLPVAGAAFTGPMWGIRLPFYARPVAWLLGGLMSNIGLGGWVVPGTGFEAYALSVPFEGNALTRDARMWQMMGDQLRAHEELRLGGPSYSWLFHALRECRDLARMPAPDVPAITFVGTDERVVDVGPIAAQMMRWGRGRTHTLASVRHEALMENAQIRAQVIDAALAMFEHST